MRHVYPCIIAFLCLLPAAWAADVEPWQSPLGPDGVTRIVVEAEDMKGVSQTRFGGTAPEWRVGRAGLDHYQCNIFGGHWQSRTRTAMTDAGDNPAALTAEVEIPRAGEYKLWVKYECPPFFNYAFEVLVTPPCFAAPFARGRGGQPEPLFKKTFGLIESAKHYCFTDKLTAGSLYWPWGLDHDAAEGYTLRLPAGKCRLTIAKTRNPAPAGMRSIDVLMITDDLSDLSSPRYSRYPLLDELRRANHVFLRFRVPQTGSDPLKITWDRWGKRYPDFYQAQYMDLVRYYDRNGSLIRGTDGQPFANPPALAGQIAEPLKPGETSVWLDVGPTLNVESAATFVCKAAAVDEQGAALPQQPAALPFGVDLALAPDAGPVGRHPLVAFDLTPEETGGTLTFLLQPDLGTKEGLRWSMKLADAYRTVTAELDRTPRRAPMPKRMRLYSGTGSPLGFWGTGEPPWSWEVAMDFRRALGLNTVYGATYELQPADYRKQEAWCQERGYELLRSASYHHSQDVEAVAKHFQELGTAAKFHYLSYGDEIGLPAVDATSPEMVAAFQEYLRQQGVTPETLGLKTWEEVKPLSDLSPDVAVQIGVIPQDQTGEAVDRTLKRLYWHSCQFRVAQGIADFAGKTARFRELLGPEVHTSANLGGMHPFYWVHQSSFIEAFKHNAMTLAWTEDYDYTQPEASRLAVEFLAGYLKAGTRYNGQRMMFYCMPHYPGQSPEHLLQNAVLEWGQNVKDLDWFNTVPDGFSTENYVNVRGGLPTFRMLREVSEMAGAVEDWLEPAKPVPAPVALLLSEASDLWEVGGLGQGAVVPGSEATNAFQEERKNTYYVLRNAGYRVDLLTESDVRDGFLKPYQALYVCGENLERTTAPVITDWVRAGGLLYASAGAARKDEYDEPLAGLDEVLGRGPRVSYDRYRGPLRAKLELLFLQPLDRVKMTDGSSFDALGTRERFALAPPSHGSDGSDGGAGEEAEVLATYADGSPAFVKRQVGSGIGYYIGTMPGQAWAKKALPVMPCGKGGPESSGRYPQFEPVDFDAAAARVILKPLADARLQPDVRANKPHVICNRLEGPRGTVVTVVNLGHQQRGVIRDLTLAVDGLSGAGRVWSFYHPKGLKHQVAGRTLTLHLPTVKLVDIVVVEK